jgi:hypothetical protein
MQTHSSGATRKAPKKDGTAGSAATRPTERERNNTEEENGAKINTAGEGKDQVRMYVFILPSV